MTVNGYNQEMLFGRVLDQGMVKLSPESLAYTSLWERDDHGVACLNTDSEMSLRVFHGLCREYERPFVIDVGAHIGTFSLVGAVHDNIRGWAFEPYADAFAVLRQNIGFNSMNDRFTLFNNVLANFSGSCPLRVPANKVQSHLACVGRPNYRRFFEQSVEAVALDSLITRSDIESVDIMRIDTEGSELNVLLGAAETISMHCPDLLIKYNWFKCAQSEVYGVNLLNYLAILGYQCSWVGVEDLLCRHPVRNRMRSAETFAGWAATPKIAIIKQKYDEFGPWQNERYDAANPLKVLDNWPTKYSYFEMTHLYKADWYVVPYCHDSRLVRQKIRKYRPEMDATSQTVGSLHDIPLDDYDVVISLDPILRPSSVSKTVFAYVQNEHHDSEYIKSLNNPLHGYDLFLDHMMEAPSWVYNLPQSLAFPYTRNPAVVRTLRSRIQDDTIWIDNRFVMMLSHGNEACHDAVSEKILHNLGREIGARFRFRQAVFNDIQQLQTPYAFMQELSQSRYYVNLIACGAGQGLCDAASLGLICFGTPKLKYHQAICHPVCLCIDLIDFKRKFIQVSSSPDLQREIMAWQDLMLADRMVRQPLHMLETAIELKRRKVLKTGSKSPRQSCTITRIEVGEELPETGRINYLKLKALAKEEHNNNNHESLIDYCKQSLFFHDRDIEVYFVMACAYFALDDMLKAVECLDKSKEIDNTYKPVDQLLALIGADYIKGTYMESIDRHNSGVNKLRSYLKATVITQIDDFDLINSDSYDEIVGDLVTGLKKSDEYEIHRMMIYHLGKQLKTVVAAELAG